MTAYVLLCRHGEHQDGVLTPVQADTPGRHPINAVAERLGEELGRTDPPGRPPITLAEIRYADSPEARATLAELAKCLGLTLELEAETACTADRRRIPATVWEAASSGQDSTAEAVTVAAESLLSTSIDGTANAVLVVGHQPMLGRIADSLLRPGSWWQRLVQGAPSTPIDQSGMVCLARDPNGPRWAPETWVVWAISFEDKSAAEEVRVKIARKMDAAKTFASLLTLGLPLVLGVLFDKDQFDSLGGRQWALQSGTALYLVSAALFLATMFAYDSLLMPQRFWGETAPGARAAGVGRRWLVERPPSSAAWVLYQNMMRIWRNLFTVAAAAAFLGTALLSFGALRVAPVVSLATTVLVVVLVGWWMRRSRPVLGSED